MENSVESGTCVNCERNDSEIPLLQFRFQDEQRWVCTGCLPTLLHKPANLAGRLPGAENIKPAKHAH